MPLVNFKVELKFKLAKHCALAAVGVANADLDSNNTIITIKDTNLYVPAIISSSRDNQKLLNGIKVRVSFKNNIEKKHFTVMIRIILTFANQISL